MGETFCVLQMPRGNLEVVSPRASVLAAIADALLVNPLLHIYDLLTWVPMTAPRQSHRHAPKFLAGTACDHAKVYAVTLCSKSAHLLKL